MEGWTRLRGAGRGAQVRFDVGLHIRVGDACGETAQPARGHAPRARLQPRGRRLVLREAAQVARPVAVLGAAQHRERHGAPAREQASSKSSTSRALIMAFLSRR